MKNIKTTVLLLLLYFPSCSGDSNEERMLFNKVKTGMTTKEVIKILGIPDDTTYSIVDSSEFCYYFFTKNKYGIRSTLPLVCFDKNNQVEMISYGE